MVWFGFFSIAIKKNLFFLYFVIQEIINITKYLIG